MKSDELRRFVIRKLKGDSIELLAI
jgi:hypothetical protein